MNAPRRFRHLFLLGLLCSGAFAVPHALHAISSDELNTLRVKAENGNGIAQYNLGLVYADQQQSIADIIEAYVWLNLAADNGATGKALVLITNEMTPEQISDGKRRLEERRAELAAKKSGKALPPKPAAPAASPVSAPAPTPVTAASPIVATASSSPVVAAAADNDIAALQTEQRKLSTELAAAWKENDQLKAEVAKAGQTTAALDQLKKERDQLAATVAASNNEIATLRAAAANLEGERNALRQKVAAAGPDQKESLSAELAAANAKLKATETELAQANRASGELNDAKQTIANLNDQLKQLAAAQKELADARNELSAAKKQLADNAAHASESERATAELNSAKQSVAQLTDQVQKLTTENQRLTAGVAAAGELERSRKSNTELASQVQKLTAERDQAVAAGKSAADAKQQKEAAESELAATKAKLKTTEDNLAKTEAERAQLAQKSSAPAPENPALRKELEDTQLKLEAALRSYQTQQQETERVQKALANIDNERADLAKQLGELKAIPAQSKAELTKAVTELADARARLAASEQALAKANAERTDRASQLAAKSAPNPAVEAELTELRAKLKAAEDARAAAVAEKDETARRLAAATSVAPAAPAAAASTAAAPTENPDLQRQLDETQIKLDASLRAYQQQQDEIDRLQKALANIDNERAQLADKLQAATQQASAATALAGVNNDAAAQLATVREQLRQTQNQLASVAMDNAQLKNRIALLGAPPASTLAAPTRPGTSQAQAVAAVRPPTAPATPPAAPEARTYTVASGDTLSKIAKRYYGSSERWNDILDANRSVIRDPGALTVGMKLRIP